ncbi:MAG TPA: Rieske 2Fe-2S domain-containing protein [Chloroflexia bacterium]|nr:Rieske 2Fe-2S domain-containing protein [Chloroflexia bacterium]
MSTEFQPEAITGKVVHRRKFLKGMAVVASLGVGTAALAACGDNTNTPAPAATTAAATTAAATTAASTTAAATTAASATTAAVAGAGASAASGAPDGYSEVAKLSAAESKPASFTINGKKGYVYAKSPTDVYVFSNICGHKGCEVPYAEATNNFVCPCHGSTYSLTGDIVKGPTTKRLQLFDNKVVGDVVYAKIS